MYCLYNFRAEALQSVILLMGETAMYDYWNENYKTYNIEWTKDKARAVLEAWHRKFTEVCVLIISNNQCMTKPTKWHVCQHSDQPGHLPSLIRVFSVCSMGSWGPKLSSCRQQRLWSDWADAQADLSLRWAHMHFVGFCCALAQMIILMYRVYNLRVL